MGKTIQIKRGPKNTMPILAQGELGMTTDSGAEGLFIGTGTENIEMARKADVQFKPVDKPYLTFSSPNSFTLAVGDATKHWDGTLEYSTDETTWSTWDGTTTLSAVDNDGEYVLYMRGTGNTKITGLGANGRPNDTYRWVLTGSDIACIGNIENLLDYATVEAGQHPTMVEACYFIMFYGCTSLTQAPALPATTLADSCYSGMFFGCTALTQAPALPATTLVNYCYGNMFQGCTALTQAPALPATTLASDCYSGMFYGCTSLTQAPALPATTLADSCYSYMFFGCTSLTQAPALPATTSANRCYQNMFQGCTSLTQAPALPATTLATYCYQNMFRDCTSLIQAPALPATTLVTSCYSSMFQDCTALTQAPALPATTLANSCYQGMFHGCASLTQAPALPATTLAEKCYYAMFNSCTSLTQAPALPATTLARECYYMMFNQCTSLTQAPALPATTLTDGCYQYMFQGCTRLKLSTTQTGEYMVEYRIPTTGTGTTATDALTDMFASTGGTFTGTPEVNTTYYLSSDNMVVRDTEIATLREYVGSIAAPASHASDETIHVTAEEKTAWNAKADAPFKPTGKSYLTFSSPNSFTLAVGDATKHWDGTLEYFASDKTWATWDGTTTLSAVDNDGEYVLYLRGTGNTTIIGGDRNYKWVLTGTDISCIGNIENLLDYTTVEAGNHPTMISYCYAYMFADCTALTQAPALPSTTLTDGCYFYMFSGCTSLTKVFSLPATTLAIYCYDNMFADCTALTQAPALHATTLADYCYTRMFSGCTSLTQAPALPATTLSYSCYSRMFYGCTSLSNAPALPATTLANYCYEYMFQGCISLTKAPSLPATTLAESCYFRMFFGCTSLKLSSTQTGEYTQEYRIPSSGTGTTAADALGSMFTSTGGTFTGTPKINTTYYLSSDNMVVHDTEVATLREYVGSIAAPSSHANDTDIHVTASDKSTWNSKADAPFKPAGKSYLTFSSPNSFTLAVGDATKHWDGTLEYFTSDKTWTAWDGTTTLSSVDNDGEYVLYLRGTGNTKITGNSANYKWVLTGSNIACIGNIENLLDYATVESGANPTMANYCYSNIFNGCTGLTQAPALPATTLKDYCYQSMFLGCTSLTQAPALPATVLAYGCYYQMFYGCTSLTQAPALPATTLANYCYTSMFFGCTSLTQVLALPATTLKQQCYANMFKNCTSLTQAPALPATTLASNCYSYMFQGCTSLTQTPALPATTLELDCYQYMFQGCTSLTQAPALPATTLASECYARMFNGCTGLTQAPALPATTLADFCYYAMFYGCTSLKLSSTQTGEYTQEYRIPSSGSGTTATNALTDMFTSTGGTFTGTPSINTTYYLSSDNMVVRETEVATLNGYVGSMIDAAIGNAIGGSY